jgi:succinoglycan biosynthesis transport protein ExoP
MTGITASHHRRGLNIYDYFRVLKKWQWTIVTVLVAAVVLAALYSFIATPVYKATVQILIERQTPWLLDQKKIVEQMDNLNEEFYHTQYKLLESRALAKRVADKLQLKNNPYYASLFAKAGGDANELQKQRAEEKLVDSLLQGVTVSPIRQSRLVDVSFSHADPNFAALVVNTLARSYIELSLEFNFAASQEASVWLKKKQTEAREKLEESEAKLNKYKRDHNIVTMEDKENITAQKLEQLNKELVTAQTRRMESETRFKEINKGKPIPQVINNPLIQTLKTQEAKIIAEHSELSRKFGEGHPRMIQLTNELSATRGKIAQETAQVTQSIQNEYHMAQLQEQNLKAALNAQKMDTQDMDERSIQYRMLLRDVETNRALYENMLKSLKTTTASENTPATNIHIVYPASVPDNPVSPRKSRNILLGGLLGLVLGAGLSMVLENLDTTITTMDDVQGWLEVPSLAIIPHLDLPDHDPVTESPGLVVHHGTLPLASESYRVLRTSIFFSTPDHGPRILLLTSSVPGEGKTLTVANLGIAMAKAENDVLLIDSDLRRPSLNRLFNIPSEPGLTNFLVGEIDNIPAVATMTPHLFLVPSGTTSPNPSELIGSGRMREFLSRAREDFSFIIMDSPPLISVTDAALLARYSEGVVLMIRYETVPRKVAREARDKLLEVKSNLLGVVLNDVPLERDSYYHKYYSHYYHDNLNMNNVKAANNYAHSLLYPQEILKKLKNYFRG